MALEKNTLFKLLDYLEELIAQLENKQVELKRLEEDMDFMFAVERRLQLAVEATINIAEHIVAGLNLAHPETAGEAFITLGKEGIIDQSLVEKLTKAVGLRNVLVHDYMDVDLGVVIESSTEGLRDLREFTKQINDFLIKQV